MPARKYLDFEVSIELDEASELRVKVLTSPSGHITSVQAWPFGEHELENFILKLSRPRKGVRRVDSSTEMDAAKELGTKLYEAVFDGQVGTIFERSLDEANRQGRGLRIRLRMGEAPELWDVPWEYLHNRKRFLAVSTETPIVRYIEQPGLIRPHSVQAPLQILTMVSSPSDYTELDVEAEWQLISEALGDLEARALVRLHRLPEASMAALQQELRRSDYHIFHFIGHGVFDPSINEGVLVFEDQDGKSRKVSGEQLGTIVHDHDSMRLIVLNSCEGARTSPQDAFGGVAHALVNQGIPAVIGMQFEITDGAAITFSRGFYASVADGYPIDAALSEARKAMYSEGIGVEWGIPVLHMRTPDGGIFSLDPPMAGHAEVTPTEVDDEPLALHHESREERIVAPAGRTQAEEGPLLPAAGSASAGATDHGESAAIETGPGSHHPIRSSAESPEPWLRRLLGVFAGVAVLAVLALAVVLWSDGEAPPTSTVDGADVLAEAEVGATAPDVPMTKLPPDFAEGRIVYSSAATGDYELYVLESDGLETQLTDSPGVDDEPAWSPDGSRIAFTSSPAEEANGFDIYVMDADGTNRVNLTNAPGDDREPAWSPDGEQIAFGSNRGGDLDVYLMDADGANPINLTNAPGDDTEPAFSPDGSQLAFTTTRDGGDKDIFVMDLDDMTISFRLLWPLRQEDPTWSPDGTQLAFTSNHEGHNEIWLIEPGTYAETREAIPLTDSLANERDASWSPDGTHIALTSDRDGSKDVYVVRVNGSGEFLRLTDSPVTDGDPAWTSVK